MASFDGGVLFSARDRYSHICFGGAGEEGMGSQWGCCAAEGWGNGGSWARTSGEKRRLPFPCLPNKHAWALSHRLVPRLSVELGKTASPRTPLPSFRASTGVSSCRLRSRAPPPSYASISSVRLMRVCPHTLHLSNVAIPSGMLHSNSTLQRNGPLVYS